MHFYLQQLFSNFKSNCRFSLSPTFFFICTYICTRVTWCKNDHKTSCTGNLSQNVVLYTFFIITCTYNLSSLSLCQFWSAEKNCIVLASLTLNGKVQGVCTCRHFSCHTCTCNYPNSCALADWEGGLVPALIHEQCHSGQNKF